MSPRSQALAYLIWWDCRRHRDGWDSTVAEIADSINRRNVTSARVRRVLGLKGWHNRVRVTATDLPHFPGMPPSMDAEAAGIVGRFSGLAAQELPAA